MKKGTHVRLTRRNGERINGRIDEVRVGGRGAWFDVNIAEPRQPKEIVSARAAALRAI